MVIRAGFVSTLILTMSCAQVGGRSAGSKDAEGDAAPAVDARDANVPDVASADRPPASQPDSQLGCINLQCRQTTCAGGATTSLSGTTFAPDGKLPLYNVMVYVPNAPLPPFSEGVTCDRCGGGAPVRAVASAISNEQGKFRITNVPAGQDVPLVFQVGKWRRQIIINSVEACKDNAITDPNLTRLPRNRREGDMPRIAVTQGGCDFLGCLLPNVGVDESELGVAGQDRAVTFYKGVLDDTFTQPPATATAATTLWRSEAELSKYDMVLLSCECDEMLDNKGPAAYAALTRYLAKGGRVFGTDYMYAWYRSFTDPRLSGAVSLAPRPAESSDRLSENPMTIDTTFLKGKAMADWLKFINPAGAYGELAAKQVFDNVASVMSPAAQVWTRSVSLESGMIGPRIFSINTPVGAPAEQQCGRAVHMDAHIGPTIPVGLPVGFTLNFSQLCGGRLTPGEEALAFLFFDLAGCVQEDSRPVVPPIIVP